MGPSSASLHLVTHQSDRQQSGGLMTQARRGHTALPFAGSRSLFLYNLARQSTDDSSFDNEYLLFLLPFSCHDAALGALEAPFSLSTS